MKLLHKQGWLVEKQGQNRENKIQSIGILDCYYGTELSAARRSSVFVGPTRISSIRIQSICIRCLCWSRQDDEVHEGGGQVERANSSAEMRATDVRSHSVALHNKGF